MALHLKFHLVAINTLEHTSIIKNKVSGLCKSQMTLFMKFSTILAKTYAMK